MRNGIYVVSKVQHAQMWKDMRDRGYPIISSWIDDGLEHEIDFSEAWPRYLAEAAKASFVVVFALKDEVLKGGLLEVGAALANGAHVFIVGEVPALRTVRYHLKIKSADTVPHAFHLISEIAGTRIGTSMQHEAAAWVERVWGPEMLYSMHERGKRVGEEGIELMQSVGITKEEVTGIVDHVYSRPPGVVEQEIGGVGTTIMTFCHAWGVSFIEMAERELQRVLAMPVEHFRKKHKEKVKAGISMLPSSLRIAQFEAKQKENAS